ncbi:MAG: ATP-dependent helicase [Kiritimatiellaeota bacterium]|nr:ATP-dependent helicase [Kiritimatiellota bacterium]
MVDFSTILNAEQHEAVTAPPGAMLVLAAAGTGKTHTLVHRVAWLIEQGEAPDRLLLLTFTNRAAKEMIERAKRVAGEGVGEVWSGTFHHVCNRILRRFGHHLGFGPSFRILDRDDAESLVSDAIKALGFTSKDFPKKGVVASVFSRAASAGAAFADMAEDAANELECEPEELVKIHGAYEARKRELGAMDFDDLLLNGLNLVESVREVRERYQQKFRHILVDEYQDTNGPQARLVDLLAQGHGNVMAVGDDFQCIYSWRGANFKNIMGFPERHPGCRIVKLEQNYRSSPEILDVANACIKGNPEQFQKTLRPTRPPGKKPRLHRLRDGDEQAHVVAREIRRLLDAGRDPGEIAVLYRAHFHSIELQMTLSRLGIAHEITSGVGVFEQAHTKDVLAFLRMAVDPCDTLAFQRLLAMMPGAGPRTVEKWWLKQGGRFDALDAGGRAALRGMMKPAQQEAWQPVEALYAAWGQRGYARHGDAAVLQFLKDFYDHFLARNFDNPEKRREDVEELALHIGRAESIAAFLNEVALLTNTDHSAARREQGAPDAVHLSTVHQAKGLEWPVVFILWMTDGMFPAQRALADGDDTEERRLFYVACTRAKESLWLGAPESRNVKGGGMMFMRPSRFVKELPRGLLEERF